MVRFFDERAFGAAGERVIGRGVPVPATRSRFMVLTDGASIVPLASSRDFKRVGDGDRGPNTGGMGAVSRRRRCRPRWRHAILRAHRPARARGPGAGGPPLPRRPLRRSDADRRRSQVARVQLPVSAIRRPRWCCRGSTATCSRCCGRRRRASCAGPGPPGSARPCACVVLAAEGYPGGTRARRRDQRHRRGARTPGRPCLPRRYGDPGRTARHGRRAGALGRRSWRHIGRGGGLRATAPSSTSRSKGCITGVTSGG